MANDKAISHVFDTVPWFAFSAYRQTARDAVNAAAPIIVQEYVAQTSIWQFVKIKLSR